MPLSTICKQLLCSTFEPQFIIKALRFEGGGDLGSRVNLASRNLKPCRRSHLRHCRTLFVNMSRKLPLANQWSGGCGAIRYKGLLVSHPPTQKKKKKRKRL